MAGRYGIEVGVIEDGGEVLSQGVSLQRYLQDGGKGVGLGGPCHVCMEREMGLVTTSVAHEPARVELFKKLDPSRPMVI